MLGPAALIVLRTVPAACPLLATGDLWRQASTHGGSAFCTRKERGPTSPLLSCGAMASPPSQAS
eukprot:8580954-Alexandrium_andersonii.AAC.1